MEEGNTPVVEEDNPVAEVDSPFEVPVVRDTPRKVVATVESMKVLEDREPENPRDMVAVAYCPFCDEKTPILRIVNCPNYFCNEFIFSSSQSVSTKTSVRPTVNCHNEFSQFCDKLLFVCCSCCLALLALKT